MEAIKVLDFLNYIPLSVAVLIALYSIYWQSMAHKREVTLHMHGLWNSESMRAKRRLAYDGVLNSGGDAFNEETLPEDVRKALGDVRHFFADLNHLMRHRSLHRGLAKSFFRSSTISYFERVLLNIVYSDDDRGARRRAFFEQEVYPLYRRFGGKQPLKH